MLPRRLIRAACGLAVAGPLVGASLAAAPPPDAGLAYATYLGGTGDDGAVVFQGDAHVAVDPAGDVYVAGTTASDDFPTTPGAVHGPHGGLDVYVTKLSPRGELVWSTVLGGPCDDAANDVAVDAAGNAYVTGRVHGGGNCYADVKPGALVAKLDPTGAVVWATSLGGRLADSSAGQAIAVDAEGHAYVAGVANSATHDFPTTPGAFRTTECANVYPFAGDGFVAKLTAAGDALVWSTILCGGGDDAPSGIAIDAAGVAYVAGSTASSDFPTERPLQAARHGGPVALTGFVTALAPDGSHLVYSTYLGGSDNDWLEDIAVDAEGNAYVTGETESQDFPTTPGVLQPHAGNRLCLEAPCTDAFVAKLDPTGSTLVYSTYLYGELDDAAAGIAVDGAGDAWVVGSTVSLYFPTVAAFQPANRGLDDAFVAKLSADGTRLLYSSYLGGSRSGASPSTGGDAAWGVALDPSGDAWVAGYTQSYDFPATADAFQPHLAGGTCDVFGTACGDAFVAKVAAGGRGVVSPVDLATAPADVAQGGTLAATWAGLPAPAASDSLQLYALGASFGDSRDVVAWWWTGAAAAGTLALAVPGELPLGTYELRLVGTSPASGLPAVMARSEPIRVVAAATSTTTTTLPGDCTATPAFAPIVCPLRVLLALIHGAGGPGRAFVARVEKVGALANDAATRCARGRQGPARQALGRLASKMESIHARAETPRARRRLAPGLADEIAGRADRITGEARRLRGVLTCP